MNEREAQTVAKMVDKQLAAAEKRIVAKAEAALAAALENVPQAQQEQMATLLKRITQLEADVAAAPTRFAEGVGKHIAAIRQARAEARGPQQ